MDESTRPARIATLPMALFAIAVGAEGVAVVLSWGLEAWSDTALYAVYAVVAAAAGMLVASRHRTNPIGWLMLWSPVTNALLCDLPQGYGLRAAQHGWPGGSLAELIASASVLTQMAPTFVLWLIFPTGRLLSRRWVIVPIIGAIASVLVVGGYTLSSRADADFVAGTNPYVVDGLPTGLAWTVGNPLLVLSMASAAAALFVRLHRSRDVERQQVKLLAFAAVIGVVVLPIAPFLWDRYPIARAVVALAVLAEPVAIVMAMFRYRLYDIDRVISRTISYSVVTAALVAIYVLFTVALGGMVGRTSTWATAGATLAAAAAFRPVRTRAQAIVDRRFDRARFDALARIDRFIDDLRAGRAVPEEIEDVLRDIAGSPELAIHHRPHDARAVGADNAVPGIPVRRGDALVATVTGGHALQEQRTIITDAVAAAGLAIEISGLRLELRRQLDEVEASRARLVTVADQERRRLERDLHDGAQQRLVSIGLSLRHAQHQLRTDDTSDAIRTLDDAVAEITVAIDELRELAHGLRPSTLDAGLGPALRELAQRAPLPVEVDTTADRFAPDAETTAYFVACEALTNAIKHSYATRVALGAAQQDGTLVMRVTDDGVGGATQHHGSGLRGMADRLAALGGTLTINSGRAGTTITASIPCAS